jgi:hypothetical protein
MRDDQIKRGISTSFCFGTGREAYNKVFLPGKKNIPDVCVPGPGMYENKKTVGKDAKSFSIKAKLNIGDPGLDAKKKNVPGPGYYQNIL